MRKYFFFLLLAYFFVLVPCGHVAFFIVMILFWAPTLSETWFVLGYVVTALNLLGMLLPRPYQKWVGILALPGTYIAWLAMIEAECRLKGPYFYRETVWPSLLFQIATSAFLCKLIFEFVRSTRIAKDTRNRD